MKRFLAAAGSVVAFATLLMTIGGEPASKGTATGKLPLSFGALNPRLAPDGQTIAFSYQGELWTIPRVGGTMTLVCAGQGDESEPAWSPDGTRIALVRGGTILVVAANGQPIRIPSPPAVARSYSTARLEFSPDGQRILGIFQGDKSAVGFGWYDLAKGSVTPIEPTSADTHFTLTPDGKSIVYTTRPDVAGQQNGNNGSYTDVWRIAADGGKAEKLFRFPARITGLGWADPGRSLCVVGELGRPHDDLWLVPLANPLSGMRQLTSGQADENRPSISRDGRWLCYTDNRDGSTRLVVRDTTTGDESTVRATAMDYRRPTGIIKIQVVDGTTGRPTIARTTVQEVGGPYRCPPGSLYRERNGLHFYCDGTAEFTVPAGRYRIRCRKGNEYSASGAEVAVEAGKTTEVAVTLNRWAHMAKSHWYSGEVHIHANYGAGAWYCTPETMRQQCVGEDINVSNFVVANSNSDVVFDRQFFRGGPDPLSTPEHILYWNQEFRSTIWGHMTLVNLKQLVEPIFTGFEGTTNPWDTPTNGDVADRTHWQKGLVNYTHVASTAKFLDASYAAKALPIDAALGKIDTVDLHLTWDSSIAVWYRLLNCGLRLPAAAGTDCFLNRIQSTLPGHARVYVQLDGPLTYEAWIDNLRAGRSFVTAAPILDFTVDGKPAGATLKLGERPTVRVKAAAKSPAPMKTADLIHNGKVLAPLTMAPDGLSATLDRAIDLPHGGWLAVRVTGNGTADTPASYLNAHTNPVYLEVNGRKHPLTEDAKVVLDWIDQFEVLLRARDRFPTPQTRDRALEQIEAARNVYRRILKDGQ